MRTGTAARELCDRARQSRCSPMRHRCSATVGMACMLAHCTAVRLQAETGAAAAVAAQPGASGHQAGCTTDIQLVFWTLQSNTATQHSRRTIAQPLPAHLSPGCWPPQQPARPRPLAARPLGLLPPSAGCRLCWKQAAAAHLDRQPHARQGRRAAAGCAAAGAAAERWPPAGRPRCPVAAAGRPQMPPWWEVPRAVWCPAGKAQEGGNCDDAGASSGGRAGAAAAAGGGGEGL